MFSFGVIRALKPPEAKVRAVTLVNSIRPRYANAVRPRVPEAWKPVAGGEERA